MNIYFFANNNAETVDNFTSFLNKGGIFYNNLINRGYFRRKARNQQNIVLKSEKEGAIYIIPEKIGKIV